jgi:NAD(P)H-hydrate repair Nnr-like enzyme with NAD(P)H-hydrate epimerase domain
MGYVLSACCKNSRILLFLFVSDILLNMIIMHETAAPRAIPGIGIQSGDTMYHVMSDLEGEAGTIELILFMRKFGAHDSWIQAIGTYREHFDIFGHSAEDIKGQGIYIANNTEVAAILNQKRNYHHYQPLSVPTITSRQLEGLRNYIPAHYGINIDHEIELAGVRTADYCRKLIGANLRGKIVAIVSGNGYAGKVGMCSARHLASSGAKILIYDISTKTEQNDLFRTIIHKSGLAIQTNPPPAEELMKTDLIIDAFHESFDTTIGMILHKVSRPILSLELPAGLNSDENESQNIIIEATTTLSFGIPRRGISMVAAQPYTGNLWLANVGIPRRAFKNFGIHTDAYFYADDLIQLERLPLAKGFTSTIERLVIPFQ